jgi:tetratricopeptide (TPR) repeat protein
MKFFVLFSFYLVVQQTLCALEAEKISAITNAITFSAKSSEVKLVGEYVKNCNDFRTPSLIKCTLGERNLSSFASTLSPVDLEKIEISFSDNPAERMKEFEKCLIAGESLFNVKDIEKIEWQEAEQYNRAWGSFVVDKKNFCRISCLFDAKKVNRIWNLTRLMVPLKDGKSSFLIVFDENTSLNSKDALIASHALLKLGKTDKAKETLLQVLKNDQDNTDAWILIGDIYRKTNNPKSKEFYQNALEASFKHIDIQLSEFNNKVATQYKIYKLLGEEDKAQQYKWKVSLKYPEVKTLIELVDSQFDIKN